MTVKAIFYIVKKTFKTTARWISMHVQHAFTSPLALVPPGTCACMCVCTDTPPHAAASKCIFPLLSWIRILGYLKPIFLYIYMCSVLFIYFSIKLGFTHVFLLFSNLASVLSLRDIIMFSHKPPSTTSSG